jgi:DNA polymerase (family 10)
MSINQEIAKAFYEIADLMEMLGIEWKPIAYRKAARVIESYAKNIEDIAKDRGIKGLMDIPGVGESIAEKILEFLKAGKISELEKLKKEIPRGLLEVMNIQGLGPKKAWKLYKKLKIIGVKELEEAAAKGRIRKLEGFGVKSEQDILLGLSLHKKGQERMLLGKALPIAESIMQKLKSLKSVHRVDVAGSVRRMKETVKDIDILVISKKPKEVMNVFTSLPEVKTILAKGGTKSSVVLKAGLNADIRILEERNYGAALNYFTGAKEHNVRMRQMALKKGWTLSEYGLFAIKGHKYIAGKNEEELYKKFRMQYVPPEMRENSGEIEAALKHHLPKLVEYDEIRGDMHLHTKWSDGVNTTEEMIKYAVKLGYKYIAIADHSKSEHIANGLDEKRLKAHLKEIEKLQKKYSRIKVFKGAEVDILADGKLDYSPEALKQLDFVVASIHSRFKSGKEEMTKRIIRAIENPYVKCIAHPTGRLINQRNPYEVDFDKLFQAAKSNSVVMEINSQPSRLDLQDIFIRKAKEEYKLKFIINTDAHSVDQMNMIKLGIAQARRGWLEASDILNTLPLNKFERAIQK